MPKVYIPGYSSERIIRDHEGNLVGIVVCIGNKKPLRAHTTKKLRKYFRKEDIKQARAPYINENERIGTTQ